MDHRASLASVTSNPRPAAHNYHSTLACDVNHRRTRLSLIFCRAQRRSKPRTIMTPTRVSMLSHIVRPSIRPLASIRPARAIHGTALRQTSSSNPPSSSGTYSFSFLPANALEPKAIRTKGLTEIRGPYYAPVTKTYLDELLKDWGEYVDGVKFAGGAFSLMPEDRLRALIDTAHDHGAFRCGTW